MIPQLRYLVYSYTDSLDLTDREQFLFQLVFDELTGVNVHDEVRVIRPPISLSECQERVEGRAERGQRGVCPSVPTATYQRTSVD